MSAGHVSTQYRHLVQLTVILLFIIFETSSRILYSSSFNGSALLNSSILFSTCSKLLAPVNTTHASKFATNLIAHETIDLLGLYSFISFSASSGTSAKNPPLYGSIIMTGLLYFFATSKHFLDSIASSSQSR